MPIVAITGATGFIGRHLTAHLVAQGATVRAIVRPESQQAAPEGSLALRVPLTASALRPAFAGASVVIHLAGVVESARASGYTAVNVTATGAVAQAAREAGARLVHVSSLAAAGPAPSAAPRSEDAPSNPITLYGRSKLAGERAVTEVEGLDWTILRPGAVYGPGDRALLPLFRLVLGPLLPVVGRQDAAFTFVHVRDVVAAIVAAANRTGVAGTSGRTYFVGHPTPVTAQRLVELLTVVVGRRPPMVQVPPALAWFGANAADVVGRLTGRPLPLNRSRYAEMCADGFVCRVDRIRDDLGVEASTSLEDGLAEVFAWYVREGWLTPKR